MKMYRAGLEGGRPAPGAIGAQPEWFYKGRGDVLRAHGQPLDVPSFALDGGEEAEIAGVYVIGPDGTPFRVGLVQGNEFSDHVGEARNYLYLAESKLRTCSIGPELVVSPDDGLLRRRDPRPRERRAGRADGAGRASRPAASGGCATRWPTSSTTTSRTPSTAGPATHTCTSSAPTRSASATPCAWRTATRWSIAFEGFGRPLRNPIRIDRTPERLVTARAL